MSRMHRTQIYLEPELNEALDRLAEDRGTSKGDLIREAARRLVDEERQSIDDDPIWGIVGMASGPPGNASVDHDQILAEEALAKMRVFRE